jgi:hypothetical protein
MQQAQANLEEHYTFTSPMYLKNESLLNSVSLSRYTPF